MSQSEIKIGPDGENLQGFKVLSGLTDLLAQELEENVNLLSETREDKEAAFLNLMSAWENKEPQAGLAREFFTLGKRADRVIFCTNPLVHIGENGNTSFLYLALCRRGFFSLRFVQIDSPPVLNYIENPFQSDDFRFRVCRDRYIQEVLCFHSLLRGQEPGRRMKLSHSSKYGVIAIQNEFSQINGAIHLEKAFFDHFAEPLKTEDAYEIFQAIQQRVQDTIRERLEEIQTQTEENRQDVEIIEKFVDKPQEEKAKRKRGIKFFDK